MAAFQHQFLRNVLTVVAGTAVAQVVTVATIPLLTRLFGPESIGLLGIFSSMATFVFIVASLAYPSAIVLPRSDRDATILARLCALAAVGICALFVAVFHLWGPPILGLFHAQPITQFSLLIPLAALFMTFSMLVQQWLIRQHAYRLNANAAIANSVLLNSTKVALGCLHPSALMLIFSNTLGYLTHAAISLWGWLRMGGKFMRQSGQPAPQPAPRNPADMWTLAREHRDFPLLRMPQNLINAASQSLPLLLLASFFGSSAAGQYSIAQAALLLPASLIGDAVAAVFYPRITEVIREGGDARGLIVRTTLGMAATGGLPFLVVLATGPYLFPFAFGSEWQTAGHYAQLLAPWYFLQFINRPAVAALPALRLQGGLLVYEVFSTGSKILALWLGFSIFDSDLWAVGLFSFAGVIAYVWLILWTVHRSNTIRAEHARHQAG